MKINSWNFSHIHPSITAITGYNFKSISIIFFEILIMKYKNVFLNNKWQSEDILNLKKIKCR